MNKWNVMQAAPRWTAGLLLVGALAGCAPLVLGTAAGGALIATDRRTSGTQVEDQAIELKASNRMGDVLSEKAHVNAHAYNRLLLLTGEVPTEQERQAAEQAVQKIENLNGVINEIAVLPASSVSTRGNDILLAAKVRATLVDAPNLISHAFKIAVERGEVYMMGMVTEREAKHSSELIATIKGVRRVVKVFQIVTEEELANKLPAPTRLNGTPLAPASGATPASAAGPQSAVKGSGSEASASSGVTATPLLPADPVQVQPLPPVQP